MFIKKCPGLKLIDCWAFFNTVVGNFSDVNKNHYAYETIKWDSFQTFKITIFIVSLLNVSNINTAELTDFLQLHLWFSFYMSIWGIVILTANSTTGFEKHFE